MKMRLFLLCLTILAEVSLPLWCAGTDPMGDARSVIEARWVADRYYDREKGCYVKGVNGLCGVILVLPGSQHTSYVFYACLKLTC